MQHSFIQKFILAFVAAFFFAGLIWVYQHVVVGADQALNGKYEHAESATH